MNFGRNAKSLAAAREALARRRRRSIDNPPVDRSIYMASCPVCSQMCAVSRGKRLDPDEAGGFTVHPHQPKGIKVGWFSAKAGPKLTAADFMEG